MITTDLDTQREYIVTVRKDVDWKEIHNELVNDTSANDAVDSNIVPDRVCECCKERPNNPRNTHYHLTENEARKLRQDSRILAVQAVEDIPEPIPRAFQDGNFNRTSTQTGQQDNWGLLRHVNQTNIFQNLTSDPGGNYEYVLDGTDVDMVIVDTGIQVGHPEWNKTNYVAPTVYTGDDVQNVTGDGSDFFKRELTVNGVRIMAAGAVGGQTAVPDEWIRKVAQLFKWFTRPTSQTNSQFQELFIKTLRGDAGTYHAGFPTIQRTARGAGDDYSTNFLTDAGIIFWNLTNLYDTHVQNDMVWYLNSTGGPAGNGNEDAQEAIEHVFHTLHMHGLPAEDIKLYPYLASDWNTSDLYNAMVQAYDAGKWDPSGYQPPGSPDEWKTNGDAFEVAAKEYLYLLNFCMFDYTSLWQGGSLSPEWTDDMRTPAGIQANNPLGAEFFYTWIQPCISKIPLETIQSLFRNGDTGNPYAAGRSGYIADSETRLKQINWFTESNNVGTQPANFYTDTNGHGSHCIGTMAGKTFGWCKNSDIYNITLYANSGNNITWANTIDTLIDWHNAKPTLPDTGAKKPTVVNMSFGYVWYIRTTTSPNAISFDGTNYYDITGGRYRGVTHTDTLYADLRQYGINGEAQGGGVYGFPRKFASEDADVETLINNGIHVCCAAGNDSMKVDVPSGTDYNNYLTIDVGLNTYYIYYHRGGTPSIIEGGDTLSLPLQDNPVSDINEGFYVGASETTATIDGSVWKDNKTSFSQSGPGVNIYTAGRYIISAQPNNQGSSYFANSSYRQAKYSGTSMAAPQMCGMIGCLLQAHPDWTPIQVVNYFQNNAVANMRDTGLDNDYGLNTTIHGSANRIAYFPMNGQKKFGYN